MRRRLLASSSQLVLAIIFLQLAYVGFIGRQPVVFYDDKGQIAAIHDLTGWFRIMSWTALIVGALLLGNGIRSFVRRGESHAPTHPSTSRVHARQQFIRNGWFWAGFNVVLIGISIWAGYEGLIAGIPQTALGRMILCICLVGLVPLFVIGAVGLAGIDQVRTPKWSGFPLDWVSNPLQALFITTWCSVGAFLGGLFRLGASGIWQLAIYGSLVLGLVGGRAIVHWLYLGPVRGQASNLDKT